MSRIKHIHHKKNIVTRKTIRHLRKKPRIIEYGWFAARYSLNQVVDMQWRCETEGEAVSKRAAEIHALYPGELGEPIFEQVYYPTSANYGYSADSEYPDVIYKMLNLGAGSTGYTVVRYIGYYPVTFRRARYKLITNKWY